MRSREMRIMLAQCGYPLEIWHFEFVPEKIVAASLEDILLDAFGVANLFRSGTAYEKQSNGYRNAFTFAFATNSIPSESSICLLFFSELSTEEQLRNREIQAKEALFSAEASRTSIVLTCAGSTF
jgi:hypothetical protein